MSPSQQFLELDNCPELDAASLEALHGQPAENLSRYPSFNFKRQDMNKLNISIELNSVSINPF